MAEPIIVVLVGQVEFTGYDDADAPDKLVAERERVIAEHKAANPQYADSTYTDDVPMWDITNNQDGSLSVKLTYTFTIE